MMKTPDEWKVANKLVELFFPLNDWFAWLPEQDAVPGFKHLKSFWQEYDHGDTRREKNPMADEPWRSKHHCMSLSNSKFGVLFALPYLCFKEGVTPFLPLIFHVDGDQFQRNDSIVVISMKALLSAGNVGYSQILLAAFPEAAIGKSEDSQQDAMHQLWKALVSH